MTSKSEMERIAVRNELRFLEDTLRYQEEMVALSMDLNRTALKTLELLEKRLNALSKIWNTAESSKKGEGG